MNKKVLTVQRNLTVHEAALKMASKNFPYLIVKDRNHYIGIVTEKDFLKKIIAAGKNPRKLIIEDIMSSPLVTTDELTNIKDAARLMSKKRIRRLPVIVDGKLIGVLNTSDFTKRVATSKSYLELLADSLNYQSLVSYPI
tara:strand:+ start:180 stop:599 length:420 start_codon:yes stop_codon:yes gene_type:complete